MQCNGQPHVCGPFNGRRFCHDIIAELRRLAERNEPLPCYPQPAWWKALRFADERDIASSVALANGRNDYDYFERQHICTIAAGILANRDGFSSAVHRSAGGATRILPEIHEFKTPEDGRRTRWQNERGQVERAKITARATGNGVTRAPAP